MRFKEWVLGEARFKGFQRQFNQQTPGVPDYVRKQLYHNRLTPSMADSVRAGGPAQSPSGQAQKPPVDYDASTIDVPAPDPSRTINQPPSASGTGELPSAMTGNLDALRDVTWGPRPVVLNLSPTDFDENSVMTFMVYRFGYNQKPPGKQVRNNMQRFDTQKKLAASSSGTNEPVVLIRDGQKYKVVEGWHRVMSILLAEHDPNKGAPQDQVEALRNNDRSQIDLSQWRQVPIRAYVGVRNAQATRAS